MKKLYSIAFILAAVILVSAPLVSSGSNDAKNITEFVFDQSTINPGTPLAVKTSGYYFDEGWITFNYVPGPSFALETTPKRYDSYTLYAVHNRWYIDISNTSSGIKETLLDNPSVKWSDTNDHLKPSAKVWRWSACV